MHHSGNTKEFHLYPVLSKYSGLGFTLLPSHSVSVEVVTLAQVLNLFYFFIETERTLLTSEDHGFGRFESWERFDWLLL